MKKIITAFIFLVFLLLMGLPGFSQKQEDKGEIVMSADELQSFIKKIALLKQQQIERQQKERLLNELQWTVLRQRSQPGQASAPSNESIKRGMDTVTQKQAITGDDSLKEEIQQINKRLDVMMEMIDASRSGGDTGYMQTEEKSDEEKPADYPSPETGRRSPLSQQKIDTLYLRADGSVYTIIKEETGKQSLQNAAKRRNQPEPASAHAELPYRVDTVYTDRSSANKNQDQTYRKSKIGQAVNEQQARQTETKKKAPETDFIQPPAQIQKAPDTIYVYQDEAGYRTSVSAGQTADASSLNSRNKTGDVKNAQTTSRKTEAENIRVIQTPPQTIYLNQDRNRNPQPIIIYRDQRDAKSSDRNKEPDSIRIQAEQQQIKLENKINSLEAQISLLGQLLSGSEKNEQQKYNDDINRLKMQVSALTTELETARMKAEEETKQEQKPNPEIVKDTTTAAEPKSNIYKVYFANNSVEIPRDDYSPLTNIVDELKNDKGMMVLLRGFASSTGNAVYNEKIANQRAAAVQKWFISNGIQANNIITQGRGVDDSSTEDQARRVEITLLSK